MEKIHQFISKIVTWLDPKLDKFRQPKPKTEKKLVPPETLEDFIKLLKATPRSVLSSTDRAAIASAINFKDRRVGDVMIKKDNIIFIHENDFLGPLMLDKLYQSGFSHFPVISSDGRKIVGIIDTKKLNSLDVKSSAADRAGKYLDSTVYYLRDDYTLDMAMAAFLRTNSFFFIVVDSDGHPVGQLTYQILVEHLLGYLPEDDFSSDSSLGAVMKRNI